MAAVVGVELCAGSEQEGYMYPIVNCTWPMQNQCPKYFDCIGDYNISEHHPLRWPRKAERSCPVCLKQVLSFDSPEDAEKAAEAGAVVAVRDAGGAAIDRPAAGDTRAQ